MVESVDTPETSFQIVWSMQSMVVSTPFPTTRAKSAFKMGLGDEQRWTVNVKSRGVIYCRKERKNNDHEEKKWDEGQVQKSHHFRPTPQRPRVLQVDQGRPDNHNPKG
jgi:hypothetical protein